MSQSAALVRARAAAECAQARAVRLRQEYLQAQEDADAAWAVLASIGEEAASTIGVKAAARLAGVSPRTIVRRAKDSGIGEPVGQTWRFRPDLVEAFFK